MLHKNASVVPLTLKDIGCPMRDPRWYKARSILRKIQLLLLPNLERPLQSLPLLLPANIHALAFLPDQTPDVALRHLVEPIPLEPALLEDKALCLAFV